MEAIGLWGECPYWAGLLRREGVPFVAGVSGLSELPQVLVLDRIPARREASALLRHVETGNCLLAGARCAAAVLPGLRARRLSVRHILPDSSLFFRNVGPVRLGCHGFAPSGPAAFQRAGGINGARPAVTAGPVGRGWAVVLPFEPAEVLAVRRTATRRFFVAAAHLPFERVAAVDRGGVRRLTSNCLRFLLFKLGLPFVRLSSVPGDRTSIFGFRIDTDESGRDQLLACAELTGQTGVAFTWFVHTGALPGGVEVLRAPTLRGQDIQLHSSEHVVSGRRDRDYANFAHGRQALMRAGFQTTGVAAPYGHWTPGLADLFAQMGFEYSSEFCYSWDDLPDRPLVGGREHAVLQVPVHPICVGSLVRAGANPGQMREYYRRQVSRQLARMEPCLLYDHPATVALHVDVLADVIRDAQARAGGTTTITDYARWWASRERVRLSVQFRPGEVVVDVAPAAGSVWVVVEQHDRWARVPAVSATRPHSALGWQPVRPALFDPAELAALQPDIRTSIQELVRRWQRRSSR